MSDSKRVVQITLPNLHWKDLLKWRTFFILTTLLSLVWSIYWWKKVRPYAPVERAILRIQTQEIFAEQSGRLSDLTLDEGDVFSKGQQLFSYADSLLSEHLRQADEKMQELRRELSQEKHKLDQNMQQYVYLQNELEAAIGPTELTDQILAQIQQQQEKIIQMERDLSLWEADQLALRAKMEKQFFTAPFEGMVLRRFKQLGERASEGEPLFLLCDKQKRWVEADVPETLLAKVRLGLPVRIEFPSFPGKTWLGQISWISPIASEGSFKIRMTAENLPLYPGLSAKAFVKIH